MTPVAQQRRPSPRRLLRSSAAVGVLLAACAGLTQAQTIYRIVGPDGKVTFSDQPPASEAKSGASTGSGSGAATAAATGRLPLALRKVAGQYPVVLYTGRDCVPCNSGRNLLINRGIPFSEKTVDNAESADALKQLSGQSSIPLLTIGTQQLKGFSDTSWTQYLTAAGYPEKSALPANYPRPTATPLAEAKSAAAAAKAVAKTGDEPAEPADIPVAPPVNNPAGIRF